MGQITITITADEDDLRAFVAHYVPLRGVDNLSHPVANAIAAALPKPRIKIEANGLYRVRISEQVRRGAELHATLQTDGLDPDEWEVAKIIWPSDKGDAR